MDLHTCIYVPKVQCLYANYMDLHVFFCLFKYETVIQWSHHAFQSLKYINYKHKQLIQRNKKPPSPHKSPVFSNSLLFWSGWLEYCGLAFLMHPVNGVTLITAFGAENCNFQAIHLRSLSFLPEIISAIRNQPVPVPGTLLLVDTFIWTGLCASIPAVPRNQGISDTIKYAATCTGKAKWECFWCEISHFFW